MKVFYHPDALKHPEMGPIVQKQIAAGQAELTFPTCFCSMKQSEEVARWREAYNSAMANWKAASQMLFRRDQECRDYIDALKEFADYELNPKYVCWPKSEYMTKARAVLEKKR